MQISRRVRSFLFASVLVGVAGHAQAEAQTIDATVAPRGFGSFRVGGTFSAYDARFGHPFGAGQGRESLADEAFFGRIDDEAFAPFTTLRTGLNAFFAARPGTPFTVDPGDLALTTSRLRARADHRSVPFEVDVGVLPRISIGARVPLVQHWLDVTGFEIADGNVGWNPNPAQNLAILTAVDTAFAALGGGAFLPTQGSAAGIALLERVRAATGGQELQLPAGVPDHVRRPGVTGVPALLTGRHTPGSPAWALGDSEVRLSLRLAGEERTDAAGPQALTLRGALDIGVRLPTGPRPDADYLVFPKPEQGIFGLLAGFRSEIATPRLGMGANLHVQRLSPITLEQRVWVADPQDPEVDGLPAAPASVIEVRWEPGTRVALDLMPYVRAIDEIRIVAAYGLHRRVGERYAIAPVGGGATEPVAGEAATAHQLGLGLQYSTLGAYQEGRANVPFDAAVFVRHAFTGSGGAPAARTVEMRGRLFLRLW
jgi:hypothetical protein